jgi:macrolide-specific efflux system membrane fusion protein
MRLHGCNDYRDGMPRPSFNFVLLAGGLAVGWASARAVAAPTDAEPSRAWETALVERRDIGASVLATGVIRPAVGAQVAVGSRASGILRTLHVTTGDAVDAGELLAELDPVEFETQVKRAEATRVNAEAERRFADGELDRVRQLNDRGAATAVELAAAVRAAETARAREREAEAVLEAARVQLGYTSIRSPIRGIVASVSTQEGETVAASFAAPTFVTVVDLTRLEVQAYVDETDIGRIEVGQRARFRVDTWPDEPFEGRVTAIRPTAEVRDNVVNYVTLIRIDPGSERVLRPEMTATIDILLEGREQAVAIPNAALRRDAAGPWVLVPAGAGVERRDIEVGFRGSDFTEVMSGLDAGERVVLGLTPACETGTPEAQ